MVGGFFICLQSCSSQVAPSVAGTGDYPTSQNRSQRQRRSLS
ncbi:hypothetical protein RBSWK_06326 [Rhodopirellula baltica SWK14]|uniref:Uncharacterized protein n=1 Tax=Rhodopirellula baltica SWK14 TaxID=993516 RepID=L7C6D1_RHOBT|nr:hypothetical protein RBSWK_06326 [Rhodopirellula baltica SWK14]